MASYLPFDASKKVLITGAAGFIGFHLSKRLLSLGASVLGFDVLTEYYDVSLKEERLKILSKFPAFTFVKGDLADEKAVQQIFSDFKPQIVVNLAAQAGVSIILALILILILLVSSICWKHVVILA